MGFPLKSGASSALRAATQGATGTTAISAPGRDADSAPRVTQAAAPTNTITWRVQDNPRVINGTYVIPADTRVVMEPGVLVQINADSYLQVDGELFGQGTATSRIQLLGTSNYSSKIVVNGTLNLAHTDVGVQTAPASGNASLIFADCSFKGHGTIFTSSGYNFKSLSYVQFDRCKFDGKTVELTLDHATVVMRDVSFTGGAYARISYSYVYLDRVNSDAAQGTALSFNVDGPLYLDNVSVTNTTYGLGLGAGYRPGNYFLGPNVNLQGNAYPVALDGAGLLPGSTLPASGNANNAVRVANGGPGAVWGKLSVPYHLYGVPSLSLSGTTIAPGVTLKVAPQTTLDGGYIGVNSRGTADEPITFQRLEPTQYWFALGFRSLGSIMEHTIVEGAQTGVSTANNSGFFVYLNDVILRNNEIGTTGAVFPTGTQYLNNGIGHETTGGLVAMQGELSGSPASPNTFAGNGTGIKNRRRDAIGARDNWWNSPTGPTSGNNPGGTGDTALGADVIPFVNTLPDYTSDRPPVVRLHKPFHTYAPGSKVTLSWDSSDDARIVAHRVLFSKAGNLTGLYELLAELPGDQRAYEWTVPDIGYQSSGSNSYIRIIAVDSAGHERFDDAEIVIPSGDISGSLTFTTDLSGRTFKTGEEIPLDYTFSESLRYEIKEQYLLLGGVDNMERRAFVSSDTARIGVRVSGNGNRELWFYTPYFKIRPDARIGDQPPTVKVTSPQAGTVFQSGDTIPVTWTASDDEGVRSYTVQVSYDGGIGWTTLARDLPPDTMSYGLRTAPGTGHADIRVRVTAFDRRFQGSSDGLDRSFSTTGTAVNARPKVALTDPGAESQFNAGASITLTAEASDADGAVERVEFYAGNTLLGSAAAAPYRFVWNDAPAGRHVLSAKAFDDRGASTTSALINLNVNAQAPAPIAVAGTAWSVVYNGPSSNPDYEPHMAIDELGNTYLAGTSTGIGTQYDITTIKYDARGRQLWVAQYVGRFNDAAQAVGVDAQGNVYVTGETWRGLNFDGGTEMDYVTLKYDPNGNLLWARYYTGTMTRSSNDHPSAMAVDAAGNVVVTGLSFRSAPSGFLLGLAATIKYDTNGNVLWERTFDSPEQNGALARDLRLDAAGNIYVTGNVNAPDNDDNIFTLKYDAGGNLAWSTVFDTPGAGSDLEEAFRLRLDAEGNIFVLGQSKPTDSTYDYLILKYGNDGVLRWHRNWATAGSEAALDAVAGADGSVYVTGYTEGSSRNNYNADVVTLKYDANGTLLWERSYDGPGRNEDAAEHIVMDTAGNVYVGATTRDTNLEYRFTVIKYAPDGTERAVSTYLAPGSAGTDTITDMAIDGDNNLYLAGTVASATGGSVNLLALKINADAAPPDLPTLSVNDVSVTEGHTGTTEAMLTVTLSKASPDAVTVSYYTATGWGAMEGYDYVASTGGVTFNPGETSKTITLTVKGDTMKEADEPFPVFLRVPTNARIIKARGMVTILDDDANNPLYSIFGRITGRWGDPIGGATVTLSGSKSATAQTDANGNYAFDQLAGAGSYTVTPAHVNFTFDRENFTYTNLTSNWEASFTAERKYHTVGGQIRDNNNAPLAGVMVALSGAQSATTTTDAAGNYSFTYIQAGFNYSVTPARANYTFAPPTLIFNNLTGDQTANFTGTSNAHGITGRIVDGANTPLSGVAVTLSGSQTGTATSDANGNYSFNLPEGGNYTITPATAGYMFAPPSLSFANLSGKQAANFTATRETYNVGGRIRDSSNNAALAGVTVVLSGARSATTTTDAAGNYSFANLPPGGNYTITPALAHYTFAAPGATFNNLGMHQTANFNGTRNTHVVSGRLMDNHNNVALGGVVITLGGTLSGTATTDAAGNYSFANLPAGGAYTVTPVLANYTFAPPSRNVSELSANQTAFDFTATPGALVLDGHVTENGNALPGVLVTLTGAQSATTTTDAAGHYAFNVPAGGSYTVTPALANYAFAAPSRSFNNLSANQTANFTATRKAFTIGGLIGDNNNAPLAGVTVTLSGAQSATTQTNADGVYHFDRLNAGGNYVVTPGRSFYSFNPASVAFDNLSGNQTANFAGAPVTVSISGRVRDANGNGLDGVLISVSGERNEGVRADANGQFVLRNILAGGNYTLTPSKDGYTFNPTQLVFANPSADQTAEFVGIPNTASVQFGAATFVESEGGGSIKLIVTRTGNLAGAVSVAYATIDNPAAVRCDDNTTMPGTAFARCDYATSVDRITFAPGEASAGVTIPLVDDAHPENDEAVAVVLSEPTGATLGEHSTARFTITDNDASQAPNPIDNNEFFVRMQYLDFLNREPDADGRAAWERVLNNCVNADPACDRNTVSSSFFRSQEFQLKGFFVYRFYKVALNRLPRYVEITPDMRSVSGASEADVYRKRAEFAAAFAGRAAFREQYDNLSDQAFVNTLLNRYQLTAITTRDPANPETGGRMTLDAAQLLGQLSAGTLSRPQVLRAIVESDEVAAVEYNSAFVAMQYFGYLRRDPDADGFKAWLRVLDTNPEDYRTMVRGFESSVEYRLRFGRP
ncbi:MAG TPA: carboxypeptidase regulatory-like domain-containing protein [Pyrinomonadaceae bacterium]|nr:carboxypeptidase regulatory-like domain-containing protein [Pyrinomonadaceae bacterium]